MFLQLFCPGGFSHEPLLVNSFQYFKILQQRLFQSIINHNMLKHFQFHGFIFTSCGQLCTLASYIASFTEQNSPAKRKLIEASSLQGQAFDIQLGLKIFGQLKLYTLVPTKMHLHYQIRLKQNTMISKFPMSFQRKTFPALSNLQTNIKLQ